MRRSRTTLATAARHGRGLLLTGLIAVGLLAAAPAHAQSPDPGSSSTHPLVGAWLVTDAAPGSGASVATASADGTVTFLADRPYVGAWAATGDDTAIVTLVSPGAEGTVTVRALVTVAADGDTFASTYTIEPGCACGVSMGQLGPGANTATRIAPEAPGTPDGPIPLPEAAPSPAG